MTLQQQAKAFLERKPPKEINYVPGSIAESFIRTYSEGKQIDDELLELGELAMMSADEAATSHETAEAKEYFEECRSLLERILGEIS